MSGTDQDWPQGVKQIGVGDLKRLGIDGDNQIYWDGRRIEIRKSIVLTGAQKWLAAVVTIVGLCAGVATTLNSGSTFLCARGLHYLSCSSP